MADKIIEVAPLGTAIDANTWHDLTPYVALEGLKDLLSDIDAAGSGRDTQDGLLHRHRVAQKMRWDVTFRPVTRAEKAMLLTWVNAQTFLVKAENPLTGNKAVFTAYSNNKPSNFKIMRNGVPLYVGVTIPLIEV